MQHLNAIITEEAQSSPENKIDSEPLDIHNLQAERAITYNISSSKNQPQKIKLYIYLKEIFIKNFPKMQKVDISRIVDNSKHKNLIMLLNGQVMGGICFRIFKQQKIATMMLMAVTQKQKKKGFGSRLIQILKHHLQIYKIRLILAYADNLALLFFKKQGFSTQITVQKKLYSGMMKKQSGAILVESELFQDFNYLDTKFFLKAWRGYIQEQINKICIQKITLNINLQSWIKIRKFFESKNPYLVSKIVSKLPGFEEYQKLNAQSEIQQAEFKISLRNQCKSLIYDLMNSPNASIFIRNKQFHKGIDKALNPFQVKIGFTQINQKLENDEYENFEAFAKELNMFLATLDLYSKKGLQTKHANLLRTQVQGLIKNLRHINTILQKKGISFRQDSTLQSYNQEK